MRMIRPPSKRSKGKKRKSRHPQRRLQREDQPQEEKIKSGGGEPAAPEVQPSDTHPVQPEVENPEASEIGPDRVPEEPVTVDVRTTPDPAIASEVISEYESTAPAAEPAAAAAPAAAQPGPTAEEIERERQLGLALTRLCVRGLDAFCTRAPNPIPLTGTEKEWLGEDLDAVFTLYLPYLRKWGPLLALTTDLAVIVTPRLIKEKRETK